MLTWLHIGDLHADEEDDWASVTALAGIAQEARALGPALDLIFLPGDIANHGEPEQYRRVAAALADAPQRKIAIPGDHDFEPKSLDAFHAGLADFERTPQLRLDLGGCRALFLDVVSAGSGGPDFRLHPDQRAWLQSELIQAREAKLTPVVFMHAFPGDMADGDDLARTFGLNGVAYVDTGHTHYNELLNDGRVVYGATRSTGQVDEGDVGYSLHAVDGEAVSWRFKPLGIPFPFVMITSPADRRLVTRPAAQSPSQAFNHAGNMVGAGLSGLLGWKFGFVAVFWLAGAFALLSIISALTIPKSSIDDEAARGLETEDGADQAKGAKAKGWKVLLESKPLLILAAALAMFHLGNGAMLPLYGLAMVKAGKGDPAGFVAMTIVVAQAVMIVAALAAMWMAEKRGFWLVMLLTFIALPLRGLVASSVIEGWGVWPVQALDGVGAGLQSVAVPGLVARILSGTGRVNVGQGAVMTVQGLGAALSPAIGGAIAQALSYRAAFLILGSFALGSLALWVVTAPILRPVCDRKADPLEGAPAPWNAS